MSDIVGTIVKSMEDRPDKWVLTKQDGILKWARITQSNGYCVDVSTSGLVEVGTHTTVGDLDSKIIRG